MRIAAPILFILLISFLALGIPRPQANAVGKWQPGETLRPEDLIATIRDNRPGKPLILSVGFPANYRAGHIAGAVLAGPASNAAGIETLRRAVEKVPKNSDIVIYCGCCPWEACPNVRPAIELLHTLGYTHVKALVIPSNLEADWGAKGYPIETGPK